MVTKTARAMPLHRDFIDQHCNARNVSASTLA
jgi:hypothetical protein